jgi:hydrogenase/urease accessory protein HupE
MNFLYKVFAGSALLGTSNLAMAHAGHHGESLLAGFLHSLANGDLLIGMLLAGLFIAYAASKSSD